MVHTKTLKMELSQRTARDALAALFENSKMLPRDIFNYKDEMHDDVSVHIRRCFTLIKEEMLSFIKAPVQDIVCFGPICQSVHHSNSKINIAFLVDTALPDDVLKRVNMNLPRRGFKFKVYDHPLIFEVLKPKDIIGQNWSVMYNRWNVKPQFQDFDYSLSFFVSEYTKLNNDFHRELDNLPKNKDGVYTPKSCRTIIEYFDNLRKKAFDALKNDPAHEYSLMWNLWLALNMFNVREYWLSQAVTSERYYVSGKTDEKV